MAAPRVIGVGERPGGNAVLEHRVHVVDSPLLWTPGEAVATRLSGRRVCVSGDFAMADPDSKDVFRPGDVLFFFTAGAIRKGPPGTALPGLWADWTTKVSLRDQEVYVRTFQGLYLTGYRTLQEFARVLRPGFQRVNRSVYANLKKPKRIRLAVRPYALSFQVAENEYSSWGHDEVRVSREFLGRAREFYGVPRAGGAPGPRGPGQPAPSA